MVGTVALHWLASIIESPAPEDSCRGCRRVAHQMTEQVFLWASAYRSAKSCTLSHTVARFMRSLFKHKLALATKCAKIRTEPKPPQGISSNLVADCQGVVDMIINALLNIGKIWITQFLFMLQTCTWLGLKAILIRYKMGVVKIWLKNMRVCSFKKKK